MVSPKSYELLVKDTASNAVRKTTGITSGVNAIGGNHFLEAEELRATSMLLNGLPLNYTETYTTPTRGGLSTMLLLVVVIGYYYLIMAH